MSLRIAVLAMTTALTGCSLIATRAPPSPYVATEPPQCTSTKLPPAVDGVLAVLFGAGAIALATAPPSFEASAGTTIGAGALAVGFGVSTVIGLHRTTRCDAAEKLWSTDQGGATAPDTGSASAPPAWANPGK